MSATTCPDWCELPAGHKAKTVDGVRIREHRALVKMPEHQQWPPERAVMFAEERDGALDLPRGRIRCECTRPPWSDPAVEGWRRRLEYDVSRALVLELCTVCTRGLHGVTTMEVAMHVERARLRTMRHLDATTPPSAVAFEVYGGGQNSGPEQFGPGDSYRILEHGLLEVVSGGRRRTYSAGAWVYVEEPAASRPSAPRGRDDVAGQLPSTA